MSKANPATRIVAALALVFSALLCAGALASCGQDNEQLIRDSLTEELDSIKNLDQTYIDELSSEASMQDLEEFGIDPDEFFKSYLSGFDYEIQDVNVDGDTASATVVLTVKSFSEFENQLDAAAQEILNSVDIQSMTLDDVYALVGQKVMEITDNLPTAQTSPIQIDYELIDNVWTPTDASQQDLETALMAS